MVVSWFTDRHVFLLAVIFYGASMFYSLFLWRKGFRRHDLINYSLLLAGAVFHTKAMFMRGFSLRECPVNNLYEAMTFMAWTIVAVYLIIGLWPRLSHIGVFASPIVFAIGVFALMPSLDPPHAGHPEFGNGLKSLHAALALLSYGAFGLSAIAGAMFLTQEHDLKFDKLRAVLSLMPPLDRLEKLMTSLGWGGLILLTAGLALSPLLLKQYPGTYVTKEVWSTIVWVIYLTLLILHRRFFRSGRRFAWGIIGIFIFVLLTFWGINQLSPDHRF